MAQAPPPNKMIRRVQRYWDTHPIATDSVDHERGSRGSFEEIYQRWKVSGTSRRKEFLESCRDTKVLEVGCGIAIDGRFLNENGIDYQAVDLSRTSLKLAGEHFRQNGLRRRFINASDCWTSAPTRPRLEKATTTPTRASTTSRACGSCSRTSRTVAFGGRP